MRDAAGSWSPMGARGLLGREGLYLRADPLLLLQLWQHSRFIFTGVRLGDDELLSVTITQTKHPNNTASPSISLVR